MDQSQAYGILITNGEFTAFCDAPAYGFCAPHSDHEPVYTTFDILWIISQLYRSTPPPTAPCMRAGHHAPCSAHAQQVLTCNPMACD